MNKKTDPLTFIKEVRESFIGAEQVYMNGSCVSFSRMLRVVFPQGIPYWSKEYKHMVTKIGNKYYDITGEVKISKEDYEEDTEKHESYWVAVAFPQNKLQRKRFATSKKI